LSKGHEFPLAGNELTPNGVMQEDFPSGKPSSMTTKLSIHARSAIHGEANLCGIAAIHRGC
jgi:hypothetical protein